MFAAISRRKHRLRAAASSGVSGGTSRFPHYAFGSFAGATFGWASYLQAASVAPIEVLAAIQYLSSYHFASHWFVKNSNGAGTLHGVGYAVAIALMHGYRFPAHEQALAALAR